MPCIPTSRWLTALAVAAGAGPAWALSADSRCVQMVATVCLESRASEITDASVTWSDGALTSLSPPDGAFSTVVNGRRETGERTSLYSDGTLQAGLATSGGHGPALKTSYQFDYATPAPTHASSSAYLGQASSGFLRGSTADDPTLHLAGQAASDFGLNRAQTTMDGTVIAPYTVDAGNLLRPGLTGQVATRAGGSAYSLWGDLATFSGRSGPVTFQIELDGTLTANAWLSYGLFATDSLGQSHNILGSVAFGSLQPGAFARQLTGTLQVDQALSYRLKSELVVFTAVPDHLSPTVGGAVSAAADFYNTARVERITVPDGMQVAFASGSSNLSGSVVTAAVPEPQSWALMAAGLAVLLRRRSRAAPARPA